MSMIIMSMITIIIIITTCWLQYLIILLLFKYCMLMLKFDFHLNITDRCLKTKQTNNKKTKHNKTNQKTK